MSKESIDMMDEGGVEQFTTGAIKKKTLQRWRWVFNCGGELRGPRWLKLGSKVLYRKDDVLAWLDAASCEAESGGAK